MLTWSHQLPDRNDPQALALQKEREERVRRLRELQEDERKKKLEELRQHVSVRLVQLIELLDKSRQVALAAHLCPFNKTRQ